MSDPKELKTAEKYVSAAQKAEKKSFFHKPEPSEAASNYSKAADIYLKQNMYKEAKTCYERAAINWDQDGQSLSSGQCYGLSIKSAFLNNEPKEVLRLCGQCKLQYFEAGNGLPAVRVLKEYAQKMKETDPETAYELYDSLLDIVETEEKYHWEKDSFVDFAILCYEMKKYEECYKAWERAQKAFEHLNNTDGASHCMLSAIVIALERNDIVKAKNLYDAAIQKDYFVKTQDFNCADMIYRGVKNHDGDLLEIGQKNIILGFIKPEIARIIDSFKAPKSQPEETPEAQPAKPAPAHGPSKEALKVAHEAEEEANKEGGGANEGGDDDHNENVDEDWLL